MGKNERRSFTIIELLVISIITIVVSGISLVIFDRYKEDRILMNQVTQLVQILELARSKAIANDTSQCTDSLSAYVSGYSVEVNTTTIQVVPHCNTNPTPIIQHIEPQSVFVTPQFTINYNNRGYEGTTVCLPIKNITNKQCQYVRIDETGLVTSGRCTQCQPLVCSCP